MNDDEIALDPIEIQHVHEAFVFVGITPTLVLAKVIPSKEEGKPGVVSWFAQLSEKEGHTLTGAYEHNQDSANAHLSVITTIGIAEHVFGWLIFDLLRMCQVAIHVNSERNSVGEIALRYIIMQNMRIKRKGIVEREVLKMLHLEENLGEQAFLSRKFQERLDRKH